jgi:hypothetical protein
MFNDKDNKSSSIFNEHGFQRMSPLDLGMLVIIHDRISYASIISLTGQEGWGRSCLAMDFDLFVTCFCRRQEEEISNASTTRRGSFLFHSSLKLKKHFTLYCRPTRRGEKDASVPEIV